MSEVFLFNSPPRSGNVFFTFLFTMFIDGQANKCLDIKKYSDKSQKQAVFFRNPYDSIPSAVVKARIDWDNDFDDLSELKNNIQACAKEYLEAIKEAKANQPNLYLGKSEDIMANPISTIKDIALFFGLKAHDHPVTNQQINEEIKSRMNKMQKTRVDRYGKTITESLMSSHDGHMPREKTKTRIYLDSLVKELDLDIIKECYNEYMSIESTNAMKGQRWAS